MEQKSYRALIAAETETGFTQSVELCEFTSLPDNDLIVKVHFSSLNYKDALSSVGNRGVTRNYPHTPGIDAVGEVVSDRTGTFKPGDSVIVTSYDLGMNTAGGFAEYIAVPSEWAVKLPENLTMKDAMVYGTAGFTAALSVLKLIEQVKPEDGAVAVSGATGGVGSICVALLAKLGYSVTAITGKESESEFLKELGAVETVSREEFSEDNKRPILKGVFAGAVDTVGGTILVNLLKSVSPLGVVTCCGNAASPKLDMTVFPFILRGISLIGIDSQNCPMKIREQLWENLASEWKLSCLDDIHDEISLDELPEAIEMILQGKIRGRKVISLGK